MRQSEKAAVKQGERAASAVDVSQSARRCSVMQISVCPLSSSPFQSRVRSDVTVHMQTRNLAIANRSRLASYTSPFGRIRQLK